MNIEHEQTREGWWKIKFGVYRGSSEDIRPEIQTSTRGAE
jgi:hypothetical protein